MSKIGRNSPCSCGSGKKFKRCCGSLTTSRGRSPGGIRANGSQAATANESVGLGLKLLTEGRGSVDVTRGLALINDAAAANDPKALYLAATIASSSFLQARDWDAAFDLLMRAAKAGYEAAQSSLQLLAGGPTALSAVSNDWDELRQSINLQEWIDPPSAQVVNAEPQIQVIKDFVSEAVCDWLVAQVRERLSLATIYDKKTGGATKDSRRTNSACDLDLEVSGVLTFVLRGRIASLTQRQDQAMEVPKILHYAPGETFAPHFDFLDPAEPAFASELSLRGQRTDTFLIYLNDDYSGGETHFPKIALSHAGGKGDALLFRNVDTAGAPDYSTMHTGLPPTSGEKWLFSQWIREFPRA